MEIISLFANGFGIFNKIIRPRFSNKDKSFHVVKRNHFKIPDIIEIDCESEITIISKDK